MKRRFAIAGATITGLLFGVGPFVRAFIEPPGLFGQIFELLLLGLFVGVVAVLGAIGGFLFGALVPADRIPAGSEPVPAAGEQPSGSPSRQSSLFRLTRPRVIAMAGLATVGSLIFSLVLQPRWEREEWLSVTLEWGRLAPLPAAAQGFTIQTEGSMFTRGFRVSFNAPRADIDRWLSESEGTRNVTPRRPTPTSRRYLISPGGGAQHAEVTVDDGTGFVEIYVYWS